MKKALKICSPQLGLDPVSCLGGEVHDHFLIQNLAKNGNKIYIYLPKGRFYQKHKNIIVERAPLKHIPAFAFNILIIPYLFKTYNKEKFDILRVHNPYFVGLGALFFKLFHPNVPIVSTHHLAEDSQISNVINYLTVNKYDKIVCVSKYLKSWLINKYKVNGNKIDVIYNGVDPILKPKKKNKTLIKKYKLDGKFIILFMGLFIPRKNPLFLLKVIENLNKKTNNISLIFCGYGPLKQNIEDIIKDKNIINVKIFDPVFGTEKLEMLNLCDVFVLPSLNEGFGLVVAEAMACAKPVIVSNNSSLTELVSDKNNGFVIKKNYSNLWADKIDKLKTDKNLYKNMAQKAKKESIHFNWNKQTKIYQGILEGLIDA